MTKINWYLEPHRAGPGFARLRAHPDYEKMVARTLAEQRRAVEEVAREAVQQRDRVSYRGYPVAPARGIGVGQRTARRTER